MAGAMTTLIRFANASERYPPWHTEALWLLLSHQRRMNVFLPETEDCWLAYFMKKRLKTSDQRKTPAAGVRHARCGIRTPSNPGFYTETRTLVT